MENILRIIIGYSSTFISFISMLIVIYGTIVAFIEFITIRFRKMPKDTIPMAIRRIRVDCGGYLLLGLEFLIASDILETVLHPNIQELIVLGGTVVVRVVLSYFLNKEMQELKEEERSNSNI